MITTHDYMATLCPYIYAIQGCQTGFGDCRYMFRFLWNTVITWPWTNCIDGMWTCMSIFHTLLHFQLLVQVNTVGMFCVDPEFLIYHSILGGEAFSQCIFERSDVITTGEQIIRECWFRCLSVCVEGKVTIFLQMQLMPWLHDYVASPIQICGVSIHEQTV